MVPLLLGAVLMMGTLAIWMGPSLARRRRLTAARDVNALMKREEYGEALEALPPDPPDAFTQVQRGWCLLLSGRTEEGLAIIKKDGPVPREPRDRIAVWMDQARALALTNSDLTRSAAIVSKIRRALSQLPTAWVGPIEAQLAEVEGWSHLHREQSLHALASFDRAIEQPTGLPWVDAARLYGRACALTELGRKDEALVALNDAAALGPDRPNVSRAQAILAEVEGAPYRAALPPKKI